MKKRLDYFSLFVGLAVSYIGYGIYEKEVISSFKYGQLDYGQNHQIIGGVIMVIGIGIFLYSLVMAIKRKR
jgi:hypothetical protein